MKRYCLIIPAFIALGLYGCRVSNNPFRTEISSAGPIENCSQLECEFQFIENHNEFDIVHFEFTERGNAFSRTRMDMGLHHIRNLANTNEGVAVIVFVHGWKHNANYSDTNLEDFRRVLRNLSTQNVHGARNLVGVFVGWRGLTYDIPILKELTYWERKSVAEEIGRGGVTELLFRLSHITQNSDIDHTGKNVYLLTGHSLGGAIILSALNDILIDRLVEAYPTGSNRDWIIGCDNTRTFADGIVLLNPAIEANVGMQIKELAVGCAFPDNQERLMHVIRSEADEANNVFFRGAQWLSHVLLRNQDNFFRNIGTKRIEIHETKLDVETIGVTSYFKTGHLAYEDDWIYTDCKEESSNCWEDPEDEANSFPLMQNNPLVFVHTDKSFISNHNDVFNCNVSGYLTTIVLENRAIRYGIENSPQECINENQFDFGSCFNHYQRLLSFSDDTNELCMNGSSTN